jgi:hypothetical protein
MHYTKVVPSAAAQPWQHAEPADIGFFLRCQRPERDISWPNAEPTYHSFPDFRLHC